MSYTAKQVKKFIYWFWGIAVFFNALMDAIHFHPYSWVVKIAPSFMTITDTDSWIMPFDGWHIFKWLSFLFFSLSLVAAFHYGTNRLSNYWEKKQSVPWILVYLGSITLIIHNLFLHLIFK